MALPSTLGHAVCEAARHGLGVARLFREAARHLPALRHTPERRVLLKRIYFTGVSALPSMTPIAGLAGVIVISQTAAITGVHSDLPGRVLGWVVVRELAPLFAAMIVIAHSVGAMTSELAAMKLNREVESLRLMGVHPAGYLVVPRILGTTLATALLDVYFLLVAILGGLAISAPMIDIAFLEQVRTVLPALGLADFLWSLMKGILFGALISGIACYHGLRVRASTTEIPRATATAIMHCLLTVTLLDAALAAALYL